MDKELLQATVTYDKYKTDDSFGIYKMGLVAFFGGIIPTILIVKDNMESLKLDKQKQNLVLGVGVVCFIVKYIIIITMAGEIALLDRRLISYAQKIYTLTYLGFAYMIMKLPYKRHFALGGKEKPILKIAILYIIAGIIAEMLLLAMITVVM